MSTLEVILKVETNNAQRNLKQFGDQAGRTQKHLSGLGKELLGIGKAASLGAIAGIGVGFVSTIKLASDANEAMSKFNVVFANTARQVSTELDAFAQTTGRSKYELKEFAAMLGDTLKPLGFAETAAADMSTEMVKLAVDLASFNNLDTRQVIQDIQSAVVGNTETLRKYGVVASQAAIEQYALEKKLWDGTQAITAQEKAAAIMQLTIAGSADAMGDATRTADQLANQTRALQSTVKDLGTEFGMNFTDVAANEMGDLVTIMNEAGPSFVGLGESLAGLVDTLDKVGLGAEAVGEKLGGAIDWISTGVDSWSYIITETDKLDQAFDNIDTTGNKLADTALKIGGIFEGTMLDGLDQTTKLLVAATVNSDALSESYQDVVTSANNMAEAVSADAIMLQRYQLATENATRSSLAFTLATQDELKAIDNLYASQVNLELMRGGLGSAANTATAAGQFGVDQYATGTINFNDTASEKAAFETGQTIAGEIGRGIADTLSSTVSGVLNEGFNVLNDLDLGLGEDTGRAVAEDARRLAAIAAGDFSGEAAQLLKQSNPELFSKVMASENPQDVARSILADFQQGIDTYGLIDREAAKDRIRKMLFAGEQREQIISELTQELMAEGQYSLGQIQQAAGAALGTGTAAIGTAVPEEQLAQLQSITTDLAGIGTTAEESALKMTEAFASTEDPILALQEGLKEVIRIIERVKVVSEESSLAINAMGSGVGLGPENGGSPAAGAGYATGGSFTVPGGYPNDTYPLRVSSGEHVTIIPPGGVSPMLPAALPDFGTRAMSAAPASGAAPSVGGGQYGGGSTQPIIIPVYLDGRQIAEVVSEYQGQAVRRGQRAGGYARL